MYPIQTAFSIVSPFSHTKEELELQDCGLLFALKNTGFKSQLYQVLAGKIRGDYITHYTMASTHVEAEKNNLHNTSAVFEQKLGLLSMRNYVCGRAENSKSAC